MRRRLRLLAAAGILVLTGLGGYVVADRIRAEVGSHRQERVTALTRQAAAARRQLEGLERAALDALATADPLDPEALGRLQDAHPILQQAFVIVGGELVFPRPLTGQLPLDPVAAEAPARLRTVYRFLTAGRRAEALTELEEQLHQGLPPSVAPEARLLLAGLLSEQPDRRDEALAQYRQLLREARPLGRLALAVRYRLGGLELAHGSTPHRLLALVDELMAEPARHEAGVLGAFYADRALQLLEGAGVDVRIRRARLDTLSTRAAFAGHLLGQWLPVMGPGSSEIEHSWWPEGRELLVWRQVEANRTIGGRVDLEGAYTRVLEPALRSAGELLGTTVGAVLEKRPAPAGGGWEAAALGGGLPWRLEADLEAVLAGYRQERWLLYGSILGAFLLAMTVVAIGTIRSVSRALEVAELKAGFVANVSHELRTPLTLIRLYAEMVRDGYATDGAQVGQQLDTVVREADRLQLLVDNVLAAARIDTGQGTYSLHPEDLDACLAAEVEHWRPWLEEKGFQVRLERPPQALPSVPLDREAFIQALRNLLTNAVRFSQEVRDIRVRARADGKTVTVAVADRGVGVPEGEEERVFRRFHRADHGREVATGTGLGLAIVRHVAEGHGGRAWVRHRPKGGSEFLLELPLQVRPA